MKWICQVDSRVSRILRLLFVCFLLLFISRNISAKSSVKLVADTSGAWFLDGKLAFGVEMKTSAGIHKRTTGYLKGSMGWRLFEVTCDQGSVKKGLILVDKEKIRLNGNKVTIILRHKKDASLTDTLQVYIPKAKSVRLIVEESFQVLPGAFLTPAIQVRYSNGIVYSCRPWSGNSMLSADQWSLYYGKQKVTDGKIVISNEVKETMVNPVISVISNDNQEVFDMLELPLSFVDSETAYYSELPAMDGQHGVDGAPGKDGQPGQNGQPGADARLLKVFMWLDQDSSVLRVKTNYEQIINEYKLIPATTRLNIIIKGANGGNAGNGGDGGKGVAGMADDGGKGGDGGNGGNGGRGGSVEIYVSPEAEKYLPQLNINNSGGSGGSGGTGGQGGKRTSSLGASLFEVIFPGRNASGYNGYDGIYGENGPPANILPLQEADRK